MAAEIYTYKFNTNPRRLKSWKEIVLIIEDSAAMSLTQEWKVYIKLSE